MKIKTSLRKNTRFSEEKIIKILECFSDDLTADYTSEKLGINRKTIHDWYMYIRKAIYWYEEQESRELFSWTVEMDESYFWPTRVRWKRWRGAWRKTIVFWILKRNGKVYTEIIPDATAKTLLPIIRKKVKLNETEVNTDWWWSYDGLVDYGTEKHYRVHHGANEFARWNQHINGIESFWSFTKRRLRKFNGIRKEYFIYHLKESEFRYNCKRTNQNILKILPKILRKFTKQLL